MFRWCSFCQTFIGEKAPFEDYSLTHGICPGCKQKAKSQMPPKNNLRSIMDLFESLKTNLVEAEKINPHDLIKKASDLGISSSDLLAGLIQPLLYEIGSYYEQKKISVAQEHQFSTLVNRFLDIVFENLAPVPDNGPLDILLVSADGNYHQFGVRFMEIFFRQNGIKARAIYPSLPLHEVVNLVSEIKPTTVGFSVIQREQFVKLLDDLSKTPLPTVNVIIGGQGVDTSLKLPKNVLIPEGNLQDLLRKVQSTLDRAS